MSGSLPPRDKPAVRNWTAPSKRAHELLRAVCKGEWIRGDPSPDMMKLIQADYVIFDGHGYTATERGKKALRTWEEMET